MRRLLCAMFGHRRVARRPIFKDAIAVNGNAVEVTDLRPAFNCGRCGVALAK